MPHSVQAPCLYISRFEKGSAERAKSVPPRSKYQPTDLRSHASKRTSTKLSIGQPHFQSRRRQGPQDESEKGGART